MRNLLKAVGFDFADAKRRNLLALRDAADIFDMPLENLGDRDGVLDVRSSNNRHLRIASVENTPTRGGFLIAKVNMGVRTYGTSNPLMDIEGAIGVEIVIEDGRQVQYKLHDVGLSETKRYLTNDESISKEEVREKLNKWLEEIAGPKLIEALQKEIFARRHPLQDPKTALNIWMKKLTGRHFNFN